MFSGLFLKEFPRLEGVLQASEVVYLVEEGDVSALESLWSGFAWVFFLEYSETLTSYFSISSSSQLAAVEVVSSFSFVSAER